MSSQSAQHRTTHNAAIGNLPARPTAHKVNDSDAERVSWLWLPALGAGACLLLAYVVPFMADMLGKLFPWV